MNLKILLSVCTLLMLVLPLANVYSDVREPAVQKIIDSYIQAVGGSAISAIKSEKSTGTLTRGLSGAVPLEISAAIPGKWLYNQVFAWGDQVSFGFDGTDAWIADTTGFERMDTGQRLDFQLIMDFQAPLQLWDWFPIMKVRDSEKTGDSNVYLISAQSKDGYVTELAFDRTSGYLLRAGGIGFADYRTVGEIKRPFRISLGENWAGVNIPMVMQFADIQHNTPVDETVFQKPGCSLRGKKPPVYKPETQIELDIPSLEACVGTYQHPTDSTQNLIVSRQGNHLMIRRNIGGMEIEIKPQSPTDFSIWFLRREFHFLKDSSGVITHLVPGADSTKKFLRVK
jgi:hypothetical protein